jgi:hypothetical protein
MPVKRKRDRRPVLLTIELEMQLVEGMSFFSDDEPWYIDADIRRECWFRFRDALVERWGDVTKLAGWREFEATPEQRAAFQIYDCPSPGYAARDGIGTVSTPADPALQALRASQMAKWAAHDAEEGTR